VADREIDQALAVFLAERTRLFRIAYRVTGNAETADDVVQEAWLRWQRVDRREIKNPSAFLATATTHLAINVIQSAHHRHETATTGPSLHAAADPSVDPLTLAERAEAVKEIMGLLLTRLTPGERAAYLLRKGLDYPYSRIAHVLGINVPHARQLVRRAQVNVLRRRSRALSVIEHERLVLAFMAAARNGDVAPLEAMLAGDRHAGAVHPVTPSRTTTPHPRPKDARR
jgi:RNA polymerase sigma-70 factor (ECF subfamily)